MTDVGPVCRRPGSMPLALRISQTVDAATLTPQALASPAMDPAIPPVGVLAGYPADQCPDVAAGRRAGPAACGPGGPAAAGDVAVPAQIVSGVISSRSPGAVLWVSAKQGREQGPVRPGQVRAARLPPLQDSELIAQDQDFRGLLGLLTPRQPQPGGRPRGQKKDEPQAHDW